MNGISAGPVIEEICGKIPAGMMSGIYGPAGTGKTLTCALAMASLVDSSQKILYVDTEKGFSIERLQQICPEYKKLLDRIIMFSPANFEEYCATISKFPKIMNMNVGLIVVDTINHPFRVEIAKKVEKKEANMKFVQASKILSDISKEFQIPVLVTMQVYDIMNDNKQKNSRHNEVNFVGSFILKNRCKTIIELQQEPRVAILHKHQSLPQKTCFFEIVKEGVLVKEPSNWTG